MSTNDQTIEAEIQAKGLTAPRVTPQDVQNIIASVYYFKARDGLLGSLVPYTDEDDCLMSGPHLDRSMWDVVEESDAGLLDITICVMILQNGHKIVGVNTGPVSPSNFDEDLARKLAHDDAVRQILPLLVYELRSKLAQGGAA